MSNIVATSIAKVNTEFPTLDHLEQFVAGFLFVLLGKVMISQVHTCMTDGESLAGEFSEAIGDFKVFDHTHIEDGIKIMGKMVLQFPTLFKDCSTLESDMSRIMSWANIFKNPIHMAGTIAWNVVAHFMTLVTDCEDMVHDLSTGDFHAAGEDVGHVMVTTLGPLPPPPPPSNSTSSSGGWFSGWFIVL